MRAISTTLLHGRRRKLYAAAGRIPRSGYDTSISRGEFFFFFYYYYYAYMQCPSVLTASFSQPYCTQILGDLG